MTTPPKMLRTWDAQKQEGWRQKNPGQALIFRVLLDASPSMILHAGPLRGAYNRYVRWLQKHVPPMSLLERRCFSTQIETAKPRPIGDPLVLTTENYRPEDGEGTALYDAIGFSCANQPPVGQQILIVFTDGADTGSKAWDIEKVQALVTRLQDQEHWLAVYLGAHEEALRIGKAMGFHPGNILSFAAEQIPAAFETLQHATQKYLKAGVTERKLLAAGGVF